MRRIIVIYSSLSLEDMPPLAPATLAKYDNGYPIHSYVGHGVDANFAVMPIEQASLASKMMLAAHNVARQMPDSAARKDLLLTIEATKIVLDCEIIGPAQNAQLFINQFAKLVKGVVFEERSFYSSDGSKIV